MARRTRQRWFRHLEVLELFLGQQLAIAEEHALLADEQLRAAAPFGHPSWWFAVSLMPYELQRRLRTDGGVLIGGDERGRCELLVRLRHVRRDGFDADRSQDEPSLAVGPFQIEYGVRHVVVVTAEIAHRPISKIPPAIPARTGEVRFVIRPFGRRAEPQVEMVRRRNRHDFREPIDDLHAFVEPVLLVELFRGRGILKPPRAIHPHVHFVHRADHTSVEDLPDAPPRL